MPASVTLSLWGTLPSFFGGSGLHWDRSFGGGYFGVFDPLWVDTSTSSSGYAVGNSLTYSYVIEGQDRLADEGLPLTIAQSTMVFPFLTSSGSSDAAIGSVIYSESNGVERAGVIYWTAGSGAGSYNLVYQAVNSTISNIATGATSLSLSGGAITLNANIASPTSWTWGGNDSNFVVEYKSGGSVFLQAFNTSGTATTSLVNLGNTISDYGVATDPNGTLYSYYTTGTNAITVQTYDPTTGGFSSQPTINTNLATITQLSMRYSTNNDGTRLVMMEGTNAGGQNVLEAAVYNSSGTLIGYSQTVLNAPSLVHFDERATGVNGQYAIIYNDETTPGGSTYQTYLEVLDATGAVIAGPVTFSGLSNFDRLRPLGNGLIELDYRQGTTGNVVGLVYDTRAAGATVTGTAGNDFLPGSTGTSSVSGGLGNDIVAPAVGTETIDGGVGFNTIEFHAAASNFTLTHSGNGSWTETASYTASGLTNTYSDTITNVEVLHFTDKSVAIRSRTSSDFSQSGTSDILFRNDSTGDTGLYVMSNGAFQTWTDIGASSTAYSIVGTGDFLGNGADNVLYENLATGDVGFYQVTAGGALAGWTDIGPASTAYSIVGIGDFYGTGASEILFRNNANGDTGFYVLNSSGAFSAWQDIGASSTAYSVVGVGDFNGDGTSDVLYRAANGGDTGWYSLTNGALTGWTDIGPTATSYSVVGTGDFLGNGTSEGLFRSASTGDMGFYTVASGVATWHDLGVSSTAYSVIGVGNYAGDATSDVLFRNSSTGDTGFFQIENGSNLGWHDIGASSTAYSVKM